MGSPNISVRPGRPGDALEARCQACGAPEPWIIDVESWRSRYCAGCLREIGRQLGMGGAGLFMDVQPPLSADERAVLRGLLLDTAEVLEDMDEEADRVALARRVAEALR